MKLSQGEIADRISILELKSKHGLFVPELAELKEHWKGDDAQLDELRQINSKSWEVVERIHEYFSGELPLERFNKDLIIEDCKWAHLYNRMRVRVKNEINKQSGEHQEPKTWKSFTT